MEDDDAEHKASDDDLASIASVNTMIPMNLRQPVYVALRPLEGEDPTQVIGRQAQMLWDDDRLYTCTINRHLGARHYELRFQGGQHGGDEEDTVRTRGHACTYVTPDAY
jgi:hypothetical protein